ncbi:MAG: thymidine phosphorylase, partial [Alphaproteobacteria bacterium]
MSVLPQEIIARKRDKLVLSKDDIQSFVTGLVDKSWSDAQASAMAMAIFLNGMELSERRFLTQAMAHSGDVLSWESFNLDGPILDK